MQSAVRYSGTEPKVRVMIEGPARTKSKVWLMAHCDLIKKHV